MKNGKTVILSFCNCHTPYYRQVCRPLHRNPQPLPLTTRKSCEAKPYCLLQSRIKKIFFSKLVILKNFGSITAVYRTCPKTCIHNFTLYQTWQPTTSTHFHKPHYVHTYIPLYKFKVFPYKILFIHSTYTDVRGLLLCSSV